MKFRINLTGYKYNGYIFIYVNAFGDRKISMYLYISLMDAKEYVFAFSNIFMKEIKQETTLCMYNEIK